jgi:branched-chain amino acid aminotransferase
MLKIDVVYGDKIKEKPIKGSPLGFGKIFTDHMFLMDYSDGQWRNPRIVPYAPISIDPATMVLHYAQETFEGLKAYRNDRGEIFLFRPDMNAKRFQHSNERLCMPTIPEEDFVQAVKELVLLDRDWIPSGKLSSLYIRPFCYATDAAVGVHPSKKYSFVIILCPVDNYYEKGLYPVSIKIEENYVRAVLGGTGGIKCGGNYAGSILAQSQAKQEGYDQVLWLDGVHRRYIEEVGTMNVFFVFKDEIVTSPCLGSVLPGVTRDSCITLLKDKGSKVNVRPLPVDEMISKLKRGDLLESFGTGTAAVISPIGSYGYKNERIQIGDGKTGPISQWLFDTMTGIQKGDLKDPYGWRVKIA